MKLIVLGTLLLGMVQGKEQARKEDLGKRTLIFFFSEQTAGAPEAARAVASFMKAHPDQLVLRPAFLVQDWTQLRQVTEESPLFRTIRQLEVPLQVYDEEALRLAARWKISRLPAAALVRGGRAHVIQGASLDLESLLRCGQ